MNKEKLESVKIIHIAIDHTDAMQRINIFGLGDDSIVYQWNANDSNWYRYSQS